MAEKIKLLQSLHAAFFEHDESNFRTMLAGFALSAGCILAVFGLY